jgi:hypothetical protein
VPYRDFWDHHAPLFFYLMAPLTSWVRQGPDVYFAGRAIMLGMAATSLVLVYRLARRLSPAAAGAAVLTLAFLPRFVEKTTEVRPDGPALAAWLAAVLCLVRWREGQSRRALWGSGFWLGLAITFNLKALYGAVGLALAVVLGAQFGSRSARPWGGALARLAGGTLAAPVALAGWLAWTSGRTGLAAAARDLGTNLYFADFGREWPVADAALGFLALAFAGVALAVWRQGPRVVAHPLHGTVLWPTATTALILLLPTTPGVARHAWLPVLAALGVYAGLAWEAVTRRGGGRLRPVLVAVAVGVVLGVPAFNTIRNAVRPANDVQLAVMRAMLGAACPGEAILDGTALYVFRPAAYRYRALINGVQGWITDGTVAERGLLDDIRATRPLVAYADARLKAVPGIAALVSHHYVPDRSGIQLLGTAIDTGALAGIGRIRVDLLASGPYRVRATPGLRVALDSRAVSGWGAKLAAGPHEVSWAGPPGRITLVAVPCRERGGPLSGVVFHQEAPGDEALL